MNSVIEEIRRTHKPVYDDPKEKMGPANKRWLTQSVPLRYLLGTPEWDIAVAPYRTEWKKEYRRQYPDAWSDEVQEALIQMDYQ